MKEGLQSLTGQPARPATVHPEAVRPALWLSRLSLTAFRGYQRAVLETDARPVVLTGANGAGKTNLLEAISFLAPGRGLRRARLSEIDRMAADDEGTLRQEAVWAVAARLETPEGPRDLGTGRDPAAPPGESAPEGARERRVVRVDGQPARGQTALDEILSLTWLTPQMDGLFREGPSARRRFLDRLVAGFDPGHGGRLGSYEQALRERARLLTEGRGDAAWLSALEETMAGRAVAVAAARIALVARLNRAVEETPGPFPKVRLALEGEPEAWLSEMPALDAEDLMRERLAAARAEDRLSGGAAVGPHRSDLAATHLDKNLPAGLCSTGEQKALLVALVLAHARLVALDRGAAPLLLLDEVAAHLDARRREALFATLLELGAQAWLTGTDEELFAELGDAIQSFRVHEGTIHGGAVLPAAGPRPLQELKAR